MLTVYTCVPFLKVREIVADVQYKSCLSQYKQLLSMKRSKIAKLNVGH